MRSRFFATLSLVTVCLLLVVGSVGAESVGDLEATPYLHAVQVDMRQDGDQVPMSITCGSWSPWFSSGSYCDTDPLGVYCLCTTAPGEVEFTDQYGTRVCMNTVTGHQWTEYRFRTLASGCCGLTIFPCPPGGG